MADIEKNIIIKADAERVYTTLLDVTNYPKIAPGVQTVMPMGENLTRWKVGGPLGSTLEFSVEMTRIEPNQRIGWSTKDLPGDITTSGQIVIAPLPDNQTQVSLSMNYDSGGLQSLLGGGIEDAVESTLRNFKSYLEGMPRRFEL